MDVGIEYTIDIVYFGGMFAWYEIRRGGALVTRAGARLADAFERHLGLYIPPWKLFSEYTRAQAIDEACVAWVEERNKR
jgi:hypothetical protein